MIVTQTNGWMVVVERLLLFCWDMADFAGL
jgi:hypothetical protein